jgi:hypothetical protein
METADWSIKALLERQNRLPGPPKEDERAAALADEEEYTAFTHGRVGTRPQMTLVFRKCDGEEEGFAYAQFSRICTRDRRRVHGGIRERAD